jgi:hypothetical protein
VYWKILWRLEELPQEILEIDEFSHGVASFHRDRELNMGQK